MATADDFDAEERNGEWFWVYQSPGAAFFRGHLPFPSKKEAIAAGRKWLKEWKDEDPKDPA